MRTSEIYDHAVRILGGDMPSGFLLARIQAGLSTIGQGESVYIVSDNLDGSANRWRSLTSDECLSLDDLALRA